MRGDGRKHAIEVIGCCSQISRGLVQKINRLLPEAKAVTVAQIVDTQIRTLFLLKALLLGLAGGIGGFITGTVLAVTLGPRIARVPVLPMPLLMLWALGISLGMTLAASYLPARRAAHLDPCTTLQEV